MGLELSPWFWGVCGAFIYAGPKWVVELISARENKASRLLIHLELAVSLMVGGIGAAAFGQVALTTLRLQDHNSVSALIGLFANRLAPAIVDKGSNVIENAAAIATRVFKALKGETE
jgi:hypothetical protein